MNNYIIFAVVVVAYIVFKKVTAPKVDHINGSQLDEMMRDKKTKRQYLDVRSPGEFSGRKIKGFKNIPLDTISSRINEIAMDKPVVLICASGNRSMRAASILKRNGCENVINVRGGLAMYKG